MPSTTFDAHTTAEQVGEEFATSIAGKTVIVTGASLGGLGGESARVVAKFRAGLVILAGRSQAKLDEAEAFILAETPAAKLRKLIVDLASLESVRSAAAEVNAYPEPIDVLINNAAIMAGPYQLTTDGFESQFGTNHLGPFLFTNLILPRLLASASPRIVNVSSLGHRFSDVRYDDLEFSKGLTYDKWLSYGQSKTANALFAVSLAQRGIVAFSLHPGAIWTNLLRFLTIEDQKKMNFVDEHGVRFKAGEGPFVWKTIPEGTSTQLVAAFDPSISGQSGSYLQDAQVANSETKPYALDKDNAQKLWMLSNAMVGESFA